MEEGFPEEVAVTVALRQPTGQAPALRVSPAGLQALR